MRRMPRPRRGARRVRAHRGTTPGTSCAPAASTSSSVRPSVSAHGDEVVGDVAAEVRGVVGVDGDAEARARSMREQGGPRACRTPASFTFDERADGERDLLGHQPVDQRGVLDAAHAVIDARDVEQVERLPDVLGRALLAGVRDRQEPLGARPVEHGANFDRAGCRPRPSRARPPVIASRYGERRLERRPSRRPALRWRRKHRISRDVMPSSRSPVGERRGDAVDDGRRTGRRGRCASAGRRRSRRGARPARRPARGTPRSGRRSPRSVTSTAQPA